MKLTLDYDNKTVSIDAMENLDEVVKALQLAVSDWKEWKIMPNIVWNSYPYYPVTFPAYPMVPTYFTVGSQSNIIVSDPTS